MADFTSIEKLKFEKLFGMSSGYVLDFSHNTFQAFCLENVGVDILSQRYNYASGSKANRLRAFWRIEDNQKVGNLLFCLLNYWKESNKLNNQIETLAEKNLFDECMQIANRLLGLNTAQSDSVRKQKQEQQATKDSKLKNLLDKFDAMTISTNPHQRGYELQDLLNELFFIFEIPVYESFKRNSGGEQIDGAFIFQNWHYIVECKWTQKLADIRDLDSLFGKVVRSGKQMMGLFLSIEGWSENVIPLLKQNPDKSIILMEGYDLRCVLSGQIELGILLQKKLAKLNFGTEPYYSARFIIEDELK